MEWNDMDSAPLDGRRVLVDRGGEVRVAHWDTSGRRPLWRDEDRRLNASWCTQVLPVRWMPLPER